MKKFLIVMLTVVALVAFFTACSVSSKQTETEQTTALTDENGQTHYYEIVTDEENHTVLNEIKTDESGKPVTNKNGSYETVPKEKSTAKITTTGSSTNSNSDDNEVTFDTTAADTSKNDKPHVDRDRLTTSERTTGGNVQPATDADGWINKWY